MDSFNTYRFRAHQINGVIETYCPIIGAIKISSAIVRAKDLLPRDLGFH